MSVDRGDVLSRQQPVHRACFCLEWLWRARHCMASRALHLFGEPFARGQAVRGRCAQRPVVAHQGLQAWPLYRVRPVARMINVVHVSLWRSPSNWM